MIRKTYEIIDHEDPKLIFECIFDSENRVISYTNYQATPISTKKTTYDNNGVIESETEFHNGIEIDKIVFVKNEKGETINSKHFISQELYEEVITETNEHGFKRTTYQDGEEVEVLLKKYSSEDNYTSEFYSFNQLIEKHICSYDSSSRSEIIEMYQSDNHLLGTRKNTYNKYDELIISQEYDHNNNLIYDDKYEIKNGLTTKEIKRNFGDHHSEMEINYKYDENNNLLSIEKYTLNGKLIGFHTKKYNTENQLAEEIGHSNGNFDAIYGTYRNHKNFHYKHEYEKP